MLFLLIRLCNKLFRVINMLTFSAMYNSKPYQHNLEIYKVYKFLILLPLLVKNSVSLQIKKHNRTMSATYTCTLKDLLELSELQ